MLDLKELDLGENVRLGDFVDGRKATGPLYESGLNSVAIVGFAPSSLREALEEFFKNPEWVPENKRFIWGLNELYKVHPSVGEHWDEWFDIHDPRSSVSTRDADNIKWLSEQTKPIWMIQHYADIPASRPYPLREIVRYWESDYLTNTISMMILLAAMRGRQQADAPCSCEESPCRRPGGIIKRGEVIDPVAAFGEIRVYGVDMATDSEYAHQRPSCEAAICFARGLGIKVYIPALSDLMKVPFVYGYEGDGEAMRKKMDSRIKELKEQADLHRANGNNAKMATGAYIAVCNEFGAIINRAAQEGIVSPTTDWMKQRISELQPEIQKANTVAEQNLMRAAMLDGAHDDAAYWRRSWTGS